MPPLNNPEKDAIVDFIDDEVYYSFRRHKSAIEKVTWAIYLFATFSLLGYVIFLLINTAKFNWLNFAISIIILSIYYCLAYYSSHKPFTAFLATLIVVVLVLFFDLIGNGYVTFAGLLARVSLLIYICLNLEAAKKVQDYESRQAQSNN